MVFTKYPKQGIILLVGFDRAMQYPSTFQVMKANVFLGYLKGGIANVLNSFGHEQHLSNNLNQNNSAHGVYNVTQ
jgi:hypothetical protein